MSSDREEAVDSALEREDAPDLAKAGTREELDRLNLAEDILQKRHGRRQRRSKFIVASQTMVGYVALAGFFANAYQNYSSEQRWRKEFERTQRTDKYRSFFETTALATDPANRDKRLVGYALLKEFMDDPGYQSKATLLLEESLARELRSSTSTAGLDEEHDAAFVAILSGLARTTDCKALENAAGSIDRVVRKRNNAVERRAEIFHLYIRWLFGRAIEVCAGTKELRGVRRPLQEAILKDPELVGAKGKVAAGKANAHIAEILRDHCFQEFGNTDVANCPKIMEKYVALCAGWDKQPEDLPEEGEACKKARELLSPGELPLPSPAHPNPDPGHHH
jgi:hypothetical protein